MASAGRDRDRDVTNALLCFPLLVNVVFLAKQEKDFFRL
jgi:hypothetical protein